VLPKSGFIGDEGRLQTSWIVEGGCGLQSFAPREKLVEWKERRAKREETRWDEAGDGAR